MVLTGENRFTPNTPVPVPLFTPQIPNQPAHVQTNILRIRVTVGTVHVCIVPESTKGSMASGMC